MPKKQVPQYVVAVFSMKKRWLDRHPDAARIRVRVITRKAYDRIKNGEAVSDVLSKAYRRWVTTDKTILCDTELEAWASAQALHEEMLSARRRVDLNFGPTCYRIYAIEMEPLVAKEKTFLKMNSMLTDIEERTCVYVGLTSKEIVDRYAQHRSVEESASTKWGKKYFCEPFEEAFRIDLLDAYRELGNRVENLNKFQALQAELDLRIWLQRRGVAAYSN